MVYFGDIYTCVKCKEPKGICIFDDVERPQDEYIELADKYIAQNKAHLLHIPHDDWSCRTCAH